MFLSLNTRAAGLDLDPPATIDLAARHGFAGVDLMLRDLVERGFDPRALRERIDDRRLLPGAFPLPVDWKGDEARFQSDLERLPAIARAAQTLGLTRTGTWILPETASPGKGTSAAQLRSEAVDWHVRRLGPIVRILADYGIRIGLEVIGPATSRTGRGLPLFDRLGGPEVGALIERLQTPEGTVGLLVDAFHLHAAGEEIEVAWGRGIDQVVWVHLADLPAGATPDRSVIQDRDRGLPGEHGAVACRELLGELANRGYSGPVCIEPMAGCRSLANLDPDGVARKLIGAFEAVRPVGPQRDSAGAEERSS